MSRYNVRFTGKKYGLLTVLYKSGSEGYKVLWFCECECGRHTYASDGDLERGRVKSCGRPECEALAGDMVLR